MRTSLDEIRNGKVFNGYDYTHQCWIVNGVVQRCGHPETMDCQCFGKNFAGEIL